MMKFTEVVLLALLLRASSRVLWITPLHRLEHRPVFALFARVLFRTHLLLLHLLECRNPLNLH